MPPSSCSWAVIPQWCPSSSWHICHDTPCHMVHVCHEFKQSDSACDAVGFSVAAVLPYSTSSTHAGSPGPVNLGYSVPWNFTGSSADVYCYTSPYQDRGCYNFKNTNDPSVARSSCTGTGLPVALSCDCFCAANTNNPPGGRRMLYICRTLTDTNSSSLTYGLPVGCEVGCTDGSAGSSAFGFVRAVCGSHP